jgi:signal transduction histidine kinase
MNASPDSQRVLHTAAWMWLGYLCALGAADLLYANGTNPIGLYYWSSGLAALVFLGLAHWDWLAKRFDAMYFPLMILFITTTPIVTHHLLAPRFLPAPFSNAEGMEFRQLPVLFIGLALTAWRYAPRAILALCLGTAALELGMIWYKQMRPPALDIFIYIILIRSISFAGIGYLIHQLALRLRAQGESLAQANAQLAHYASALETLTISRERNRMARELHDTLAHTLTGLSVTLETVKAYWDVDADKARGLLDKSLDTTRSGLDETRRALKSLRASPLDDLGLGLALRQLAESSIARARLNLALALPDPLPSLPPNVEQCVYRVAQEALENIVYHADAQNVRLALESSAGHIRLTVQDDGHGFDPRVRVTGGHFGLVGMKERAILAGGSLSIESGSGAGTKVVLEI